MKKIYLCICICCLTFINAFAQCTATATISGGGSICNGQASTISVTLAGTAPWQLTYAIDGVSQPAITGITTTPYTFTTTTTGVYSIVSVNDAVCAGSTSGTASVSQTVPTATLSGGGSMCAGSTVNIIFALTAGTPPWSFTYSDGTTTSALINSNTTNKSISVSAGGTYTFVSMSDANCAGTGSGSASVTVNSLPVVTVNSPTICVGQSAILTASGATTYSWSTGSSANPLIVTPTSTSPYTVTGTSDVSVGGCTSSANATVTVQPVPVISSTASPSNTICAGSSVTLTANGALTYMWLSGSQPEMVTNGVAFTPTSTFTYTVQGTNQFNCSKTAMQTITVRPYSAPTVNILSTNESSLNACDGYLEAVSNGIPPVTYAWNTVGLINTVPIRNSMCSGNYSVTVTDSTGCSTTAYAHVGTNSGPVTNINPIALSAYSMDVSDPALCDGGAYVMVTGGLSPYNIHFAGTVTNDSVYFINNLCAGFYTVNATDANSDSTSYTFVVASPPTTFLPTTMFYVDSTIVDTLFTNAFLNCTIDYDSIDSVQISNFNFINMDSINVTWTIYNGNTTTTQNANYEFSFSGVYTLVLDLFCTNRTSGIAKGIDQVYLNYASVGIERQEASNISIYPNPFDNELYILADKNSSVKITDILGSQIYNGTLNSGGNTIHTGNYSGGIYFITISNRENTITKKVIKN